MPVKTIASSAAAACWHRCECVLLLGGAAGGAPDRLRLAGDLGQESIRKVS